MREKMSVVIISCDKFSDLWDGQVKLLEQNWPDRDMNTFIVTDAPTTKQYPGITIISAGAELEWTERLAYALKQIETDYVFITLDDYYLIKKVDNQSIVDILSIIEKERFDYMRLYKRPRKAVSRKVDGYPKIFHLDITKNYSVNLYVGIWAKSFLESTLKKKKNVWLYEASLFLRAQEYGAKCAVSHRNEFQILDVVRKGKLLHKAAYFFKKHPGIYTGNREVNSMEYEIKLAIQTMVSKATPLWLKGRIKAFMSKRGHRYFSDQID